MAEIRGTSASERLNGTAEGDELFALGGNDTVYGYGGGDAFWSSRGNDTYYGGDGRDRADYRFDPSGILADLRAGTVRDGFGNTDRLFSVERIVGSQHADTIYGGADDNSLTGEGGDDLINGRGGHDFVWYGRASGAVQVNLATGVATGGEGNDTLVSIEGLGGSNFADLLIGNADDNYFVADQFGDAYTPNFTKGGADTIQGGAGFDTVDYWNSLARVTVDLATGRANDGAGNIDRLSGIEGIFGSNHNDRLYGDAKANSIAGSAGADLLIGRAGRDTLEGGDGADRFVFLNAADRQTVIVDFSGRDRIEIDASGFGLSLPDGALAGSRFHLGPAAGDAGDRFIYDRPTGRLYFDADGTGASAAVVIAVLQNKAALGADDIILF